jgi:hypothetical protein
MLLQRVERPDFKIRGIAPAAGLVAFIYATKMQICNRQFRPVQPELLLWF